MAAQASPFWSHLLHAYAYPVGLPLQVPFEAVSVAPSCGVPEMLGVAVFAGAACPAAVPAPGPPTSAPTAAATAAIATTAGQRHLPLPRCM